MPKYFYFLTVFVFTGFITMAQPPKQAVVLYKKAGAFKEKGMFNEAITTYTNAIAIDKKYDSAYLQLAQLYTSISQADNAVRVLKEGISQIPDFTSANITLGNLYRDNLLTMHWPGAAMPRNITGMLLNMPSRPLILITITLQPTTNWAMLTASLKLMMSVLYS